MDLFAERPLQERLVTIADTVRFVERLRSQGRTVVFTNGVFDLLHPGHVRYLRHARSLGDALIVGVNSDRSVRDNRGPRRPITPEAERAEILTALECVDAVVIFDDSTPLALVKALQPDILVKGADWAEDAIVGLGGFNGFAIGVKTGGSGDVTATHRLWQEKRSPQRIGSGVAIDGKIYIGSDQGIVQCIVRFAGAPPDSRDMVLQVEKTPSGPWFAVVAVLLPEDLIFEGGE